QYGHSVEFVDHREYMPGDEPRHIDWKMLARTERWYVKRFEMESNMDVSVVLDISGSMGYRPDDKKRFTKFEYARFLTAALCYLVNKQNDAPGFISFGTDIRDYFPPKQGKRHLYGILARLAELKPEEGTDLDNVLGKLSLRLKRRGLVVLFSDFYGDTEVITDGMKQISARGHDLVVFHLVDTDERDFPFRQLTSFRDLESGGQLLNDPLLGRRVYQRRFNRFQEEIREGTHAAGGDYRFITTADPIEYVLRDYLLFRRQQNR
ncbi:MAG: DUF58 domain-containing protein, partial [Opitutales bacterium]